VFAENGEDLEPLPVPSYARGRKTERIYVYEEDLPVIKQPLPPLGKPLPEGQLLTKKGAARMARTPGWILERMAYTGKIPAYAYDELGVNLVSIAGQPDAGKILFFLAGNIWEYLEKQLTNPINPDRRITLNGVAYALGCTLSEVRLRIVAGELPAWVYGDDGRVERYQKKIGARHSIIFVKESVLKGFAVNQLPPPAEKAPTGEILLKKAAAAYLDMKPHRLQGWAEEGKIKAYVYDERGVNLVPLEKQTARKGRVLHFRKADLHEPAGSKKTT
jgi:hypothetical protein